MEQSIIQKLIQSLTKRGMTSSADLIETLMGDEEPAQKIVQCPICGDDPEEGCLLCDGTGELSSVYSDDDDEEDERVKEELGIE